MNAQAGIRSSSTASALELELLATHVDDFEQMSYTTYGVRVKDDSGNVLAVYQDISTSKKHVQGFIDLIKDRDVAAIHIGDLLEDYLD